MKRFALREFLLLCAPVAIIGAGLLAVRILHPPRDPNAMIALSVTRRPSTLLGQDSLNFGWKANATGGPKDAVSASYSQTLIASGYGKSKVIFREPSSIPSKGFVSFATPLYISSDIAVDQSLTLHYEELPIWTQKLDWQGEVVAFPQDAGVHWKADTPAMLQGLAQIKGARRVVKRFPIALDAKNAGAY